MLLLGCTGQAKAPTAPEPAQPVVPEKESEPVLTPPVLPLPPAEEPKVEEPAPPANPCEGKTGADNVECAYLEARAGRDVTVCTALLSEKDDRFKCITQWCASDARDFNQCGRLEGDDRLGCLNKCNPNQNT